jgi:acetyl esterase/lipase
VSRDVTPEQRKGVRPPFDPELEAVLTANPYLSASLLPKHIGKLRELQAADEARLSDDALRRDGTVTFEELRIPSSSTGVELDLLVLRPAKSAGKRPGICFFHGGGMIAGDERTGIEIVLDWVAELGIVVASVDYRLAPENPHPVPVEDCYAALTWVSARRSNLGIDDEPVLIAGTSAGGGLAAGVSLLARDREGPHISDQILMCPMLDDIGAFPSSSELDREGVWDARSNRTGWEALLGSAKGGAGVSPYAAPSRERSLAGLPAAYLDVGAVETYRDEVIDYAARLAQAGVSTELHVWAGAFHGFDVIAADSAAARVARATRIDYLRRRLRGRVRA